MIRHMSATEFRKMEPFFSARDRREIRPLPVNKFPLTNTKLAAEGLLWRLREASPTRAAARRTLDVIHWLARKLSKRKPTEALKLMQATTDVLRAAPVSVEAQQEMQARVRALAELPDCF